MGVDGVPIKVQGSATVHLTIARVEFEHEFIIADQITVDAILKLNFLEAKSCTLDLIKGEISVSGNIVILTSHSTRTAVRSTKLFLQTQ